MQHSFIWKFIVYCGWHWLFFVLLLVTTNLVSNIFDLHTFVAAFLMRLHGFWASNWLGVFIFPQNFSFFQVLGHILDSIPRTYKMWEFTKYLGSQDSFLLPNLMNMIILALVHNTEPRHKNRQQPCFSFWMYYGVKTIWCKKWHL